MSFWGSLFGAGASLLGGLFKPKDRSEEFAKKSIQWRVADARKAGIHPLYAMGAPTFSPAQSVDFGASIANAGQDVGRAIDAVQTTSQRGGEFEKAIQGLQLQRGSLENQLLQQQLLNAKVATIRQPGSPPPMPGDPMMLEGQGNSPLLKSVPQEVTNTRPGAPWQEPVAVPDLGYARTSTGWAPILSRDMADRQADSVMEEMAWNVRNRLMPTLGANFNPPFGGKTDKFDKWVYDPYRQEYVMVPHSTESRWYYSHPY